jgi:plasmid stabilization system protein ParE
MNVHWTEAALADLEAIETYISRRSPQYARALIERIFARSELLATQPRLGPKVPGFDDETLRELFQSPYRIIDRIVAEQRIDVVAVVHGARRLPHGF